MSLGLAMIVKDAEAELPACLASVAGVVDEIVIADTGSRDGTVGCARGLGARVVEIPWEEDFARARNRGLEAVRSDWVLVLDADERLEPGPVGAWRAQLASGSDAFQVTIRNYVSSLGARVWDRVALANDGAWAEAAGYPGYIEHENVRLFRRRPELYFVGRVHESVGPRVRAAGLRLGTGRGRIHHFGLARGAEETAAKNRRYRQLCQRKAAEQPEDFQAHFELGVMEFDNFHNDAEALRCFERSLRLQPGFALAWFFAGATLQRLGHAAEALEFFAQAEQRGGTAPQMAELQGDALYQAGRFGEAGARYREARRRQPGHAGLASKAGLAELRAGERERGLRRLRRAVEAAPERGDNHDRLITALVWCEDWAGAAEALAARIARFPQQAQGYLRLAAVQAERGQAGAAREALEAGLGALPEDLQLRQAWCELGLAGGPLKPPPPGADRSA
ncbi:MAG TPA: glycosyltransferase [Terriglobales bacterium]|nr:glycosyltransferase [Terriglobales bacterium]